MHQPTAKVSNERTDRVGQVCVGERPRLSSDLCHDVDCRGKQRQTLYKLRRRVSFERDTDMNSFATRFTARTGLGGAHNSSREDGEFSDATWGSAAGYGSLAKGVPSFLVPDVPDVSALHVVRSASDPKHVRKYSQRPS